MNDPFKYTEEELFWLMHEQGKRRFGSLCNHERIRNGHCLNCLRKVVDKLAMKGK